MDLGVYSSLAIAFQSAALAATSLGLGSQWMSVVGIRPVTERIMELIGIPAEIKIYDMLALGYPSMTPSPNKMRDRQEMTHYDACGRSDFRTDEAVRAFFGK